MAKQIEVNPEARLESRPSDVRMTLEQYLQISLFDQLKNKIKENKWPGAMVVRRYRKGEVVSRQGEPGWTAFYILKTEDMYRLGLSQMQTAGSAVEKTELQSELTMIGQRLSLLRTGGDAEKLRTVAHVHLTLAKTNGRARKGLLNRLFGRKEQPRARPTSIPIDGPTEIDASTLTATMHEGELFGEMSCLYRTPRSATVVAARDCYMLEMLRNILDKVQKDPAYKDVMDKRYKERVFQLHIRKLSLFSDLTEEQYAEIRNNLELVTFEAGQVICDEHDRSDCLYIVRGGLIKVIKKVSALLGRENVRNWPGLVNGLKEAEAQPATPKGKLWGLLAQPVKDLLKGVADPAKPTDAQKNEILFGLNDVLKKPQFLETKEVAPLLTDELKAKVTGPGDPPRALTGKPSAWSDQDLRLAGRLVLEALFPLIIRQYRRRVGPECVLSYCAKGDIIGEIGILECSPRTATCLAFGHPLDAKSKDAGRVELVRIPAQVFLKLLETTPAIREKVEAKRAERLRRNEERGRQNVTDDPTDVQMSERFQSMGLIQGQRLMLIDLDRCTRCDECVKACVNTHEDGRSRLFLDGPRFENYLVPTTCRSCLDPVCMIGCPVGSIHRGDNGQIVIEDWCIGCALCARNCPYGSIQMHDIGIIREAARGWKYTSSALAGDRWNQLKYNDGAWAVGESPFQYDREFQTLLAAHLKRQSKQPVAKEAPLCFRYEFQLSGELLRPDSQFTLELTSVDPAAQVLVNGVALRPEKEPNKKGERSYTLPQEPDAKAGGAPVNPLRAGRNVLAVWATPNPNNTAIALLKCRLDAVQKPQLAGADAAAFTQKQVTERAVVCDLCSSSFGQVPACVNACPHDAAMRVDARFEFPIQ
jgi:Fe-S-cluster-containing hydrogenase component 2